MDRKPRILHLAKWYPHANDPQNGVFVQQQIRACSSFANQAVIYWGVGQNLEQSIEIEHGIPVLRMYLPQGKGIHNMSKKLGSLQRIIREEWLGEKPDIIHLHIADRDQWVMLEYAKTQGIPVILTEHWSGYLDHRFDEKSTLAKKLNKLLINRVERCTSVSNFLADAIIEKTGRQSVDIIPNSVDLEGVEPQSNRDEGHFGVLADLDDAIKNISGVISAFAKFHETSSYSKLSIIGDGADRKKLEKLVRDLNIQDAIVFHGRKNHHESLELLGQVDTVIVNSRKETFSIVCLEAVALGKKLICTRCGGPETFLNEEVVLWTRIDDNIDLLDKMQESMSVEVPTKEQRSRQIAPFSTTHIGKQWEELYRELIKGGR